MIQFRLLAGAVTAAGLLAAMPAAAAVKIAKYSGIVESGYDQTGVFAAPGSDLTGYSWVATYTYDKTLGGVQNTDGVSFEESYGGPGYGVAGSPILSASITINGVTRSVAGTQAGLVYSGNSPFVTHYAQDFSDDGVTQINNVVYNYNYAAGAPVSLDQSFGPVAAAGGFGYSRWYNFNYSTGTYTEDAQVYLGSDAVYSVGNAVPEPASWALMIAGFGLIGTALRRRRAPVGIAA